MVAGSAIRAGRAFVELFADDSALVRTLRRAENHIIRFGEKIKTIGRHLATLGIAASIPLVSATNTYAKFDDAMRAVKAVTGAVGKEFDMLTEKAKYLGRTTSFTAIQVAGAMLELGRAGFAPKEIDDSIASVLNLARATKTDLSEATRIASSSLRAFNLPAEDMTRVCDVMVAAANTSAQTLEDLGHSMAYCAPIAEKYGLTLEQTCKAIGALSNYGIKASQAGTTFRRILVNMADKDIQKQLKRLGVTVKDIKTGNMRDVATVLKDLGVATQNMARGKKLTLFKDIFGVWAMAGGASLTAASFERLYNAIDDAGGVAARTAKEMDSGIAGSLRMLWSAVEGVAIAIGEALNPVLQPLVDWLTKAASGLVVFITNNKQLVVSIAKTVASVLGIGVALFSVGLGFIAVGKIIGLVAVSIASIGRIFLGAFDIVLGGLAAISFVGKSFVSVFSKIASTITSVAKTLAAGIRISYLVLAKLGAIAFTIIGGVLRGVMALAAGIVGAFGLIIRVAFAVAATAIPIIMSIASTLSTVLMTCITAVVSAIGTIMSALAPLFSLVLSALAPFITTCILSLQMIGGAILISVASVAYVVASAFVAVEAMIVSACSAIITTVISAFSALGAMIVSTLAPIITVVVGFCTSVFTAIGAVITAAFATVVSLIGSAMLSVMAYVVGVMSSLVAAASFAIASVITTIGSVIAGALAAMSPIIVVLLTIATAVGAVYMMIAALSYIGSVISDVFLRTVDLIGKCL
ncbi:MAG: phage tail tape measure protein, partial [Thermoguttaceae bacterium]